MRYGRYAWPYRILRISLGLVFLYIGFDILKHPEIWVGFFPENMPFGISREAALQVNAGLDIVIGSFLIFNLWPKTAASLAAIHLIGVLAYHDIDAVLIRDVGLLGAALALLFWPARYRKKKWLPKIFRRKQKEEAD